MISVITATLNSESTILGTLRSVEAQSYLEFEHLVKDGLSRDATLDVVRGFPSEKIRVVEEADSGIYGALNAGVHRSRGDIVGFLHSDDLYESDRVLQIVAAAFEDPAIELVYGNLRYVRPDNVNTVLRDWVSESYRPGFFRRGWMPPHPTVYARREVFDRIGLFDENFSICADWEWLLRAMEVHRVRSLYLPEYLVRMRVGGASNRSIRNIVRSNREAIRGFGKNGQRFPLEFFPGKVMHRSIQWWRAFRDRHSSVARG